MFDDREEMGWLRPCAMALVKLPLLPVCSRCAREREALVLVVNARLPGPVDIPVCLAPYCLPTIRHMLSSSISSIRLRAASGRSKPRRIKRSTSAWHLTQ